MIKYVKITLLTAFNKADNGFTVTELATLLNMTPTAVGKRLKAYYTQALLNRTKAGKAFIYQLTPKGKDRLEYLQKKDIQNT